METIIYYFNDFIIFSCGGIFGFFALFVFHRSQLKKFKERIYELNQALLDLDAEMLEFQEKTIPMPNTSRVKEDNISETKSAATGFNPVQSLKKKRSLVINIEH
jgi:hypothetical protein